MAQYTYRDFKEKHPDYDADYWARCEAFYAGGRKLLENKALMKAIFPPHGAETKSNYEERRARAFYIPYAGEICDAIVAALTAEPITVEVEEDPEDAADEPTLVDVDRSPDDPYFGDFYKDCSPPGGEKCSFNELLRRDILTSLIKRTAWTLVEMPDVIPTDETGERLTAWPNLQAQDAAGALDVYACCVPPENVWNWEEDSAGELTAAMVMTAKTPWNGIGAGRAKTTRTFTYYTRKTWERWSVTFDTEKGDPEDGAEMTLEASGANTFQRVPLVRMTFPEGLWAMGKIESIAREHFNKRNAVSWAQIKNAIPILYANVAATEIDPDGAEGTARLVNQPYGPGKVLVAGEKDKLSYIGPDSAPYESMLADLLTLRDEMHRVLHHMAMSVDNSGAALQRSAESKTVDQQATSVVLRAIGSLVRQHAERVYEMVQRGREGADVKDDDLDEWCAHGMDDFADVSSAALVEEAMGLENITIPSPVFQRKYKLRVAKAILGEDATAADIEAIAADLQKNITDEQFVQPSPMDQFAADNADKKLPPKGLKPSALDGDPNTSKDQKA